LYLREAKENKDRFLKAHLAGKTDQAKKDLARLAIIRKQREEASKQREAEQTGKHEATIHFSFGNNIIDINSIDADQR
jgi:hypothetical protein